MIILNEALKVLVLWVFGIGAASPVSAASTDVVAETEPSREATLSCDGIAKEGGLITCHGPANTVLRAADSESFSVRLETDADGIVTIGLPRSVGDVLTISSSDVDPVKIAIANRLDAFRTLTGLDCDKVDARSQAQKDHAGRSWVKKQAAFNTFKPADAFPAEFIRPAEGRMSSPFGPARKYTGVSSVTGESCERTSVHRGYDIAAPVGTQIIAPAAGTVILADPDLYYEGGTIFLDHGFGLVTVMMHMSQIDVEAGDVVAAGDKLGEVGNTGRTTGPHLHWAVKWRNLASDDRGADFYIDPALLLGE